ncbi:unnamed protein product [Cylindrotheca closterium]|uniref:Uncharacterized protein n=1 Tax=Cylindrotheca closterium TaxID=2856 RepID=A0AAD2FV95_9STRA|nr:unnamed protein product [Cylindrotheca closterium]
MKSNLHCVDQLRDFGIIVNDVPLQHLKRENCNQYLHSLIDENSGLHIPMDFLKPISFFACRKPALSELDEYVSVEMTSSVPWEPYDPESSRIEQKSRRDRVEATINGVKTDGKSYLVKPEQLARRWRISLECARRTLQKTTQRALRDWTKVEGSRQFCPTQFQLEYPRLRADIWADNKQGPCVSAEGNKYVAVYAAACQWACCYALKKESESLTVGEFQRVANKAQVPIHPSKPYNPDQNLAEDCICETTRMKMVLTNLELFLGEKEEQMGSMVSSYHEKPFLDTSIYEIEWHDGETESYCANGVIEAMMINVDDDGNSILHVKEFIDHRMDGTRVDADDGFVMVKNKKVPQRTTKGWYLCAQIHGDETEWIDLKTAKEAYPIQVAEYAVAHKLVSEPAFSWWVPYILKKRDRILKAVKRRALTRNSEKFGLELPGTGPKGVRRAYVIDANTGSNHWGNAIENKVKTVLPAFLRILGPNEPVPPGYTCIDLMTVFDVKMDLT